MKKSFFKEYTFLTPTNQNLFRFEMMRNFKWTTKQSFYHFIKGRRNISEADEQFIVSRFAYYFNLQKKNGYFFIKEYCNETAN